MNQTNTEPKGGIENREEDSNHLDPSRRPNANMEGNATKNDTNYSTEGVDTSVATEVGPSLRRPSVALSVHIMGVYNIINLKYCEDRRQQLSSYNNGYDDKDGHYIPLIGEDILDRFTVHEVLGKGSFGIVLHCFDHKHQTPVAVKIMRSGDYFKVQAAFEAEMVSKLNSNPSLENLVVKLRRAFIWKEHAVLVFELLSFDLYTLIKYTKYNGVSLDLTRKFAYQLVKVLLQLELNQPPVIHCDLKPENVVLRDPSRSGIRVIDFGSSCFQCNSDMNNNNNSQPVVRPVGGGPNAQDGDTANTAATDTINDESTGMMPRYIQSRFYRSPEIILGLPFTTAIDRWSLACMLVELHTGVPLFPGKNENEMIGLFSAVMGPLPDEMIDASPKRHLFFREFKKPDVKPTMEAARAVTVGSFSASGSNHPNSTIHRNTNQTEDVNDKGEGNRPAKGSLPPPFIPPPLPVGATPIPYQPHGASTGTSMNITSSNTIGPAKTNATEGREGGEERGTADRALSNVPLAPSSVDLVSASGPSPVSPINSGVLCATTDPNNRSTGSRRSRDKRNPPPSPLSVDREKDEREGEEEYQQYMQHPVVQQYKANQSKYYPIYLADVTVFKPLEEICGVYCGGPRGCRKGQQGHDEQSYELFLDFLQKLLRYRPSERIGCRAAMDHLFLTSLLELERRVAVGGGGPPPSHPLPPPPLPAGGYTDYSGNQ